MGPVLNKSASAEKCLEFIPVGLYSPGDVRPLKVLVYVTDRLTLLLSFYGKDPYRELQLFFITFFAFVC